IPGGVVDAEWKRAFIPGPEGQVEAIDLKTGKTLFASASRAIPLMVDGDRVYVLAASRDLEEGKCVVRVLAMNIAAQGRYEFASKPLPMPEWVADNKANCMAGHASVTNGKLLLEWKALGMDANEMINNMRRGLVEPGRGMLNEAGYLEIDLQTGGAQAA